MSLRIWTVSILVVALLVIAYRAGVRHAAASPPLRSQHSQPAKRMPVEEVAVTLEGKTFHRAGCKYIHGPVQMVDIHTAIAQGYVPDIRCMHDALGK